VLKKIFNPIVAFTRKLQIGKFLIAMMSIQAAQVQFGVISGIRFTDTLQSRNKQNVPPILRMISQVC